MQLILLSGGSGKRLWPLSNDSRSKQFLKVLQDENNNYVSMVQRVWSQLNQQGLGQSATIATSKSQVEMIHSQLGGNVPIVVEPERRDTFPAIALAATYLYSNGVSLDEVVTVLPVDPYVEGTFFERVKKLEEVIRLGADMALIGVKPTYPSSKYGYIVPQLEDKQELFFKVNRFQEKPNEDLAKELIKNEALWNCGVFAFRLEYMINLLIEKGLSIAYEALSNQYDLLPKISFDYEVVEKAKNIAVLPYDGYWKDLGTWNTLTEEMGTHIVGKGTLSKEVKGTHIVNELDIPVKVLGVENAIVAASPDGILVSTKEASPRVKEILDNDSVRPMYEERRWGWYKVLDYTKYEGGKEVLTKRLCINEGKNLSYQYHNFRNEVWTITKGKGYFIMDGTLSTISAGDVISIPQGAKHAVKALNELEMIEVQTGSELIEEDIVRLTLSWEETLEKFVQNSIKL